MRIFLFALVLLFSVQAHAYYLPADTECDGQGLECLFPDSAEFFLDADDSNSYGGTGNVWQNLVGDPDSGALENDYDMESSNAQSNHDGDCFVFGGVEADVFYQSSGNHTTWTEDLHKTTGGDFTFLIDAVTQDGSGKVVLDTAGTNTSSIGVHVDFTSDENWELQTVPYIPGGSTRFPGSTPDYIYESGKRSLVVVSHDRMADWTRIWVNGVLQEGSHAMNDSVNLVSGSSFHIGGHEGSAYLPDGFKVCAVGALTEALTPGDEQRFRHWMERKRGMSFTDESAVWEFNLPAKTDADPATQTSSDIIFVSGVTSTLYEIEVKGEGSPQFRTCEDSSCSGVIVDWTSAGTVGYVSTGAYAQVRATSGSTETTRTVNLRIDVMHDDWLLTVPPIPSLADSVSNVVWEVDATSADSYSGSGQTLANLIASPADGANQTDYDCQRGSTSGSDSQDPTFTGSAGSSAAYFSHDGGDYFVCGDTTFLDEIADDQDYTLIYAGRFTAGGTQNFLANVNATNGIRMQTLANEALRIQAWGGGGPVNNASTSTLSGSTDYLIIASHDHSANQTTWYVNTATGTVTSVTYNTTSGGADTSFYIGTANGGTSSIANGNRFRAAAMRNATCDGTCASNIVSYYCTQHNTNYTGGCL